VQVALDAVAPWTRLLLALFVIGLPGVLFISGRTDVLLAWLVTVYAVILLTLLQVYRHRKALNLSGRAMTAVALDALLCAPFALNLIRKIGLRQTLDVDLRLLATSALSPFAIDELTAMLRQRIGTSLDFLDPGDPAAQALQTYLAYFEGLRP
jgi:hypothetical protein